MWHEVRSGPLAAAVELLVERERAKEQARVAAALEELAELAARAAATLPEPIARAAELCAGALRGGGKILVCGNGGSAADAAHFAAELVGRMRRERAPLPAISLAVDPSVLTCVANDFGFEELFARQVRALGGPSDALVAISTSGRSPNVLAAIEAARSRGMATVALLGAGGDPRLEAADVQVRVPSRDTARIQEIHTAALHAICELLERDLLDRDGRERDPR